MSRLRHRTGQITICPYVKASPGQIQPHRRAMRAARACSWRRPQARRLPILAVGIWLGTVSAGEAFLGWTA